MSKADSKLLLTVYRRQVSFTPEQIRRGLQFTIDKVRFRTESISRTVQDNI